ncbi:MAG TPA: branched-chain amino acid ABC transporter permease [Stellaceae bacterium]|nr:branched-chain amino acid ABC transporter permease [Stellaceae bacterium]
MFADLLLNAIASGILLGGFYAAVAVGLAISFGMLDVGNLAHPAFVVLGSFCVYVLNRRWGIDPILAALLITPLFFALGAAIYEVYYLAFERRGEEGLRGLAFFFGILFITEVALILGFGVDYRFVAAPYIGPTLHIGEVELAWRTLVPCLCSFAMIGALQLFLSHSYIGRAIQAVSQDSLALRLMAINPSRVKLIAFAISMATAAVAGALLIIIQPVEPSIGRDYIGRVFAIVVLGGMGSFPGMLLAAILLGVAENLTATFYGPSWAPAVSFGLLLLTLAFRPSGIMGRT